MSTPSLRRPRFSLLLLSALALGAGSWMSGCDFTRVDEGADVPLQQHLEALSAASTPDAAERAIRGVLNKVGVRTSWQRDAPDEALAFGTYLVTDEQIRALAEEHARYVRGDRGTASTVALTHQAVVEVDNEAEEILRNLEVGVTAESRGPILVNATEASAIFEAEIATALEAPEDPANAMVLAVAATGAALPTQATFAADRELSPAQQLLYSVWLHHNGPLMFPFLTRDIDSLPTEPDSDDASARSAASAATRTSWPCDACCGGSGKFVSMTLLYVGPRTDVEARITSPTNGLGNFKPFPRATLDPFALFSVSGSGRPATGQGLAGTLGNNVGVYVGANVSTQIASIHTSCSVPVYPGMVFGNEHGKVVVVAVRTQSNGLCSNLEVCTGSCKAQLLACKFRAGDDADAAAACYAEFRSCDLNCHDQGGIY